MTIFFKFESLAEAITLQLNLGCEGFRGTNDRSLDRFNGKKFWCGSLDLKCDILIRAQVSQFDLCFPADKIQHGVARHDFYELIFIEALTSSLFLRLKRFEFCDPFFFLSLFVNLFEKIDVLLAL